MQSISEPAVTIEELLRHASGLMRGFAAAPLDKPAFVVSKPAPPQIAPAPEPPAAAPELSSAFIPARYQETLAKHFRMAKLEIRQPVVAEDGVFTLRGDQERLALKTAAEVVCLAVQGNWVYTLGGTGFSSRGIYEKSALVQFVFLDAEGQPIAGHYAFTSYSDFTGNYKYLPATEAGKAFELKLTTPPEARRLLLGFRLWKEDQPTWVTRQWTLRAESLYVPPRAIVESYTGFFDVADAAESDTFVFLYSATKSIGHSHRSNRTMCFARIMAGRGIPVLYNYYRGDTNLDGVVYDGGALFQSPQDVTVKMMVEIATRQYRQRHKVFLLSFPNNDACQYMGLFKEYGWTVVYECRDDWEEFWLAGVGKWYDPMFEQYVVAYSDAVIAISCTLRDKMQRWRLPGTRPVALIPNGLEPSFLRKTTQDFIKVRGKHEGKVVAGYHGHLTPAWFDWPLVIETARSRPQWQFQIIGFDGPEALELPANVEYLGPKSHEEINQFAQDWTVGIIPFIPSRLAEGVDPIKAYEYLAMGLPVVSVLMPQILDYPYTRCYRARGEFERMIEEASREKIEARKISAFLKTRTWDQRVEQMLEYSRTVTVED